MMSPVPIGPKFGDADFFESLLAIERTAVEHLDLPLPLQALIDEVFNVFEKEGAPIATQRPTSIQKNLIAASASKADLLILERRLPDVHHLMVLDQNAVITLAGLLLGQQNSARSGAPSPTELQIIEGLLTQAQLAFSKSAASQNLMDWSLFMAARLPLTSSKSGPAIIFMANRRGEPSSAKFEDTPDLAQQAQIRRAIGNGKCQVDYVLDAGRVSLATLRSLKPGSVLPVDQSDRVNLQATANGMPVFKGIWQFAENKMRVTITDVMAREATKND